MSGSARPYGGGPETRITELERKRRATDESLSTIDGRVTTAEGEIDALQAADVAIDGRLDSLEAADVAIDGRLDTLEARSYIAGTGTVALNNNGTATSTAKTDANVTAAAKIVLLPADSGAWSIDAGVSGVTAAAGSFTVSHSASTLTRTFAYLVIR